MANWEHRVMTEEELKVVVRDVYDCKIFTSFQCGGNEMMMVFMPVMFIGSAPSTPKLSQNNQVSRKNKLQYIEDCLIYERETPQREEYLKNIGMLYEDMSKSGPRGINGYPMFMSCKILSISDSKRFMEMYYKYEKMRKEFESEWGEKSSV